MCLRSDPKEKLNVITFKARGLVSVALASSLREIKIIRHHVSSSGVILKKIIYSLAVDLHVNFYNENGCSRRVK